MYSAIHFIGHSEAERLPQLPKHLCAKWKNAANSFFYHLNTASLEVNFNLVPLIDFSNAMHNPVY